MIRRDDGDGRDAIKASVASRLKASREEIYGKRGAAEVAAKLGIPARTWLNYEMGVTIPGDTLLSYLELTGIEPLWLLRGVGQQLRELPGWLPTEPSLQA